jgi:hypothetical protein
MGRKLHEHPRALKPAVGLSPVGPQRRFAAPPQSFRSRGQTGLVANIAKTALLTHSRRQAFGRLTGCRWPLIHINAHGRPSLYAMQPKEHAMWWNYWPMDHFFVGPLLMTTFVICMIIMMWMMRSHRHGGERDARCFARARSMTLNTKSNGGCCARNFQHRHVFRREIAHVFLLQLHASDDVRNHWLFCAVCRVKG